MGWLPLSPPVVVSEPGPVGCEPGPVGSVVNPLVGCSPLGPDGWLPPLPPVGCSVGWLLGGGEEEEAGGGGLPEGLLTGELLGTSGVLELPPAGGGLLVWQVPGATSVGEALAQAQTELAPVMTACREAAGQRVATQGTSRWVRLA